MAKPNRLVTDHLEWIGFVKPTGLVVSAPALVKAGVILNRRDITGQKLLRECVANGDREAVLPDFPTFARQVLGWSFSPKGYAGTDAAPNPSDLELPLPESGRVFRPDFAVRAEPARVSTPQPSGAGDDDGDVPSPWQLLVSIREPGEDLDRATSDGGGLEMSPHGRMERLLRHTGVPAGLVFNGATIRLVSAPRGESSGWLDFQVSDMIQTAGRPICSAMRELLGQTRLLSVPRDKRLAALLENSRKFQNEVSERLAEQVLHALYELLRGLQAAHDASNGHLLDRWLADDPDEIYRGLLTVVLRLVYLLYAEERDMLPQDETFLGSYSVSGLYERLRADTSVHPDTMDQRYGAYAQLLALWRMVHDGARGPHMAMSPKHGDLFHPDRYPFLEGAIGTRQTLERIESPRVADGTIHRVLEKLIVLDAERISYRALDVEHIGSVYETMMGFRLETASGRSIAIKAAKKHGAPATVDLEALLTEAPAKRAKWMQDRTDRKLTAKVKKAVGGAGTMEEMHAALDRVIDRNATPDLVPPGAMVLQPSQERRRSGSHYTPRELTEPIVRIALEPIMERLSTEAGGLPRPDQILDLKVCDPAMGSGAFLVEVCRQLSDALIEAWRAHDLTPDIPSDEDEQVFARRMVAQRCLYGVDRNPKAVDLAKLSLWLITLAKDHPLTFLDHALRHGDSLVGLSISQLRAFHWKGNAKVFAEGFEALRGREHLDKASDLRRRIREAGDDVSDWERRDWLREAEEETRAVRLLGDLVVAAFFDASKPRARETRRKTFADAVLAGDAREYEGWLAELRSNEPPLAPFHWPIEFPEVFERSNPGFDTIIGNPPFAGKNTVAVSNVRHYAHWLKEMHAQSHGNADLVAHFFRRAFNLIRSAGTFGLIATNTIAQGDTRSTGLRWICLNDGEVYHASRRVSWPGLAVVIVSVIHVYNGSYRGSRYIDGQGVDHITAFLFHRGSHDDPEPLHANAGRSFVGSYVLGMGFTFDDTDKKGIASPLHDMDALIKADTRNGQIIRPFIGGKEINTSPIHSHHRYVIDFRDYPLFRFHPDNDSTESDGTLGQDKLARGIVPADYSGSVAGDWPQLLEIVEARVRGSRGKHSTAKWWHFERPRPELYKSISGLRYTLATSLTTSHHQFAMLRTDMVYAHTVIVITIDSLGAFCTLQARPHEVWALFFGSSLKDDPRYTPSDCFETFPFPKDWQTRQDLEPVGRDYYEFRAALMIRNNEGMTKTYNRFHDPYENAPDIAELRTLHSAMDRAVLDAYGWTDIPTDCEFLLDFEIDEETWGRKKKPYRYRWPDDVRDEVLARLLELNAKRAAEEARAGLAKPTKKPNPPLRPRDSAHRVPSTQIPSPRTLWDGGG